MKVLRFAHHAVVAEWRQRERELRRLGADVRLVSAARWNEGGADVDFEARGDHFAVPVRTFGRHPNLFAFDPIALWRLMREPVDLIDLHEEPCSVAVAQVRLIDRLRGRRTPFVLYSAQNIDKHYPLPFRMWESSALREARVAHVCNSDAARILAGKGLRGPAVELPLGVDVERFGPDDRVVPDIERPLIGYIGRLEAHKGVDVLLHAAAQRPNWRVRIVGDGPQRQALERLADILDVTDRVDFAGHVSDVAREYPRWDVTVVPSRTTSTWVEQFGRVAVESMAAGVPVVASRSGSLIDVVADAGVLVRESDPAALAVGVDEALERWSHLRSRGLEKADRYAWRRVAEGHLDVYRRAVPADAATDRRELVAIVVAYGPADDLAGLLAGWKDDSRDFDVIVVDNSGLADTRDVAERFDAEYVDAGGNLGFAGGVNRGLEHVESTGRSAADVALVNPDARIGASDLRRMQSRFAGDPHLGCVGATQVDPASGDLARVWWPFPSPAGAWLEALGAGRWRRQSHFVVGSVLVLRAEALRDVGWLDERFFLYAEETDWQKMARRRGWTIAAESTDATHVGAGSGGDPRVRERHFHASLELFARKHHGALGWQVFRFGMVVGSAVRAVLLTGDPRDAARRRLALYLRGPLASRARAEAG